MEMTVPRELHVSVTESVMMLLFMDVLNQDVNHVLIFSVPPFVLNTNLQTVQNLISHLMSA